MEQLLSTKQIEVAVNSLVQQAVAKIDVMTLVRDAVVEIVNTRIHNLVFPESSIPMSSIKWDSQLSGDMISGGIQTSFSSQGIDDQATECRLTVMDDFLVVENTLVANSVEVKRDLVVDGSLIVKGDINTDSRGFQRMVEQAVIKAKEALTGDIKGAIADETSARIREAGLDLNKITINGSEVIDGNSLGKSIVSSNLQKVGQLKELQVRGEASLSETLYTSNRRVGINTVEPSRALSVWEEECELVMCKHERQTGYIGSIRNQRVVLGSDSQTNLVLESDGSTKIFDLRIGDVKIQSAPSMPDYSGTRGEMIFNSDPVLGKPLGWVCLGETRWACMPVITD